MSPSFGSRTTAVTGPTLLHGSDSQEAVGATRIAPSSWTCPGRGRGRLGLEGAHREMADLIRRTEVLAASGDEEALRGTAGRVVQTLLGHLEDERARFKDIEPARRGRLLAGQEALLECATRYAAHPAADAGADLLALLVRQADAEEAAVHADPEPADTRVTTGDRFGFTTDWAIESLLVTSP